MQRASLSTPRNMILHDPENISKIVKLKARRIPGSLLGSRVTAREMDAVAPTTPKLEWYLPRMEASRSCG